MAPWTIHFDVDGEHAGECGDEYSTMEDVIDAGSAIVRAGSIFGVFTYDEQTKTWSSEACTITVRVEEV